MSTGWQTLAADCVDKHLNYLAIKVDESTGRFQWQVRCGGNQLKCGEADTAGAAKVAAQQASNRIPREAGAAHAATGAA